VEAQIAYSFASAICSHKGCILNLKEKIAPSEDKQKKKTFSNVVVFLLSTFLTF
jgi:Rieske Fe-S protein